MRKYLKLIAIILFAAQARGQSFVWGVNGHPITQKDYNGATWGDQIKYLKDLGVKMYRIDVPVDAAGNAQKGMSFLAILNKLKDNGIEAMPTIIPSKLNSSIVHDYDDSFNQGKNFCAKYGDYFSVLEVGNEEDVACIFRNGVDGTQRQHYDINRVNNILVKIKGFINGAKSVKPALKVSLSLSWVHFGYLDILKDNAIDYDIIGYHWYSNMGNPTNVKTYGDVLTRIARTYQKPIWITEINYWQGTQKADFQQQDIYLVKTIKNVLSQNVVSGLFIYELFDEPALRQNKPSESYYGLLYKDSSGNYVSKDVYSSLKSLIQSGR